MSVNLLEYVQQTLHYQPLQKVDPNTQEVVIDDRTPNEERFSQAAIPATIMAFYEFSTTKDGAAAIVQNDAGTNWSRLILGAHEMDFFEKIASYSYHRVEAVVTKINAIFSTTAAAIKAQKEIGEGNIGAVHKLLADQRNMVLPYLPAEMQMGKLLNDNSLDDRTHKMEGPVSNLMHAIGNIFSSSEDQKVTK